MSRGNLRKRIERLEQDGTNPGIRIVWLNDGEEPPTPAPGEHLIVLHATDMGL